MNTITMYVRARTMLVVVFGALFLYILSAGFAHAGSPTSVVRGSSVSISWSVSGTANCKTSFDTSAGYPIYPNTDSVYNGWILTNSGLRSGFDWQSFTKVVGNPTASFPQTYRFKCTDTNNASIADTIDLTVTDCPLGQGWDTASLSCIPVTSYTLTVTPPTNGTVTGTGINCPGDCSESLGVGTTVILSANPASGHYFSGWSGACTGTGSCTVTMSANQTVGASFSAGDCVAPWGATVTNGSGVTAYQQGTVVSPASCSTETRTCTNGVLSGSYTNQSCVVAVNGVCGPANGGSYSAQPSTDLCSAGAVSWVDAVAADGAFNWNCTGTGGGIEASCSAFLSALPPPSMLPCAAGEYSGCVVGNTSAGGASGTCNASTHTGTCSIQCNPDGTGNWILPGNNNCSTIVVPPPPVTGEPVLSTGKTVVPAGTTITLSWDTNNADESLCTLTGGGLNYASLPSGGIEVSGSESETGSTSAVIKGRTSFVLTCPHGSDVLTVDIVPGGWES